MMILNNELEVIRKELMLALFEIVSQPFPGTTENYHKKSMCME
jgi:hypothetical protein